MNCRRFVGLRPDAHALPTSQVVVDQQLPLEVISWYAYISKRGVTYGITI